MRSRTRAKQLAAEIATKAEVRIRDGNVCRVCGRRADSVHEIRSKGAGGKVSLANSLSVCGRLVGVGPSCHTYLQRKEIDVFPYVPGTAIDANRPIVFVAQSIKARRWIEAAK